MENVPPPPIRPLSLYKITVQRVQRSEVRGRGRESRSSAVFWVQSILSVSSSTVTFFFLFCCFMTTTTNTRGTTDRRQQAFTLTACLKTKKQQRWEEYFTHWKGTMDGKDFVIFDLLWMNWFGLSINHFLKKTKKTTRKSWFIQRNLNNESSPHEHQKPFFDNEWIKTRQLD